MSFAQASSLHNSESSNPENWGGVAAMDWGNFPTYGHKFAFMSYDMLWSCMYDMYRKLGFFKKILLWCLYIFISVRFFFAERTWSNSKLLTRQIVMRFSSRSPNIIHRHSWVSWFQLFSRFYERSLTFEFLDNRTGTCWEVSPAAVVVHELDIVTVFCGTFLHEFVSLVKKKMQVVLLPIINDGFSSSEDQAPTTISDIRLMEVFNWFSRNQHQRDHNYQSGERLKSSLTNDKNRQPAWSAGK